MYDPEPIRLTAPDWFPPPEGTPVYRLGPGGEKELLGSLGRVLPSEEGTEFTVTVAFHPPEDAPDEGELDPRWEWTEVRTLGQAQPRYVKGRCRHLEAVPVRTSAAELIAHLCLTCDAQLPAEWKP